MLSWEMTPIMDRQKAYKWIKWVMLGIPLAIAVAYIGARVYVDYRIQQESDLVREAGYPVTLAELDTWYAPEPGKIDKTRELEAALDTLDWESSLSPEEWKEFHAAETWSDLSDEIRVELSEHLALNKEVLRKIREILAEGETWRFSVDLTVGLSEYSEIGPDTLQGPLAQLRSFVRLFCVQAMMAVEQDDLEVALSALESCLAIEKTLRTEPVLVSQLARILFLRIWLQGFNAVIDSPEVSQMDFDHWRKLLRTSRDSDFISVGFVGERAMFVSLTQDVAKGLRVDAEWHEYFQSVGPISLPLVNKLYFDVEALSLLRVFREGLEIAKLEEADRYRQAISWQTKWDKDHDFTRMLATMLSPSFAKAIDSENRGHAYLAIAESALIVLESEMAPGNAADIAALRSRFPADPFDGEPIRCRVDGDSVYLYSVSHDREDDEGRPAA